MHSIRLRGPWELYLPGDQLADSPEPRRIEMPATWESLAAIIPPQSPRPCPLRLVRRFGMPTGIEPTDRLAIVVEGPATSIDVLLNGKTLGRCEAGAITRLDVTGTLLPRNELLLLLSPSPPMDPQILFPFSDVRLEISGCGT